MSANRTQPSDQLRDEIAGLSRFVDRWCESEPERLRTVAHEGRLDPSRDPAPGEAPVPGDDDGFMRALRSYRNESLAIIAMRDLAGLDALDATLDALSELADRCIEAALQQAEARVAERYGALRNRQGEPVRLIVIGMGKLGGRELNFSSDIDLIFSYDGYNGVEPDADLDAAGYCRRVAQRTIRLLAESTAEGFVYRVDTRLRPFGDAGALVGSIAAMEQYYQAHGREWERYAWIKARPVAGDIQGGQRLIDTLRPFVYRRYLDYGAFESIREMKTMIDRQVARRDSQANIKLGYGGIREIEFLAQVFQLVRGGQESELRDNRLRPMLARLADAGHLEGETAERLDAGYVFLRRLENRLQMVDDRQTHEFPEDADERARLARAMAMADGDTLAAETERMRSEVHALFERVFATPDSKHKARASDREHAALAALWEETLSDEKADDLLERYGIEDTAAVRQALADLKDQRRYRILEARGRRWLGELIPAVIVASAHTDTPERAVQRTLSVVSEIVGRSNYIALLVEYPAALSTLMRLCGASEWITERIAEQPALLDSFLDPRQLYHPPRRSEIETELAEDLAAFDILDLDQRMNALRRFTQKAMLRIAAADVTNAMPLMIVSDHLTALAEVVLDAALGIAWDQMSDRYGEPRLDDGQHAPFAVIAYGKLGGLELGYTSDLDLVFVYDSSSEAPTQGGRRELTHQVFFTRLAQRLIHILSTATPAGRAYEIDMRLRPSGNAGLMVTHIEAFARYQREQAWTWEHQALVRARPVAGDERLGARFAELRRELLATERDPAALAAEVRSMRRRMHEVKDETSDARWDVKQMPGGLIDIEFMAQYVALAYGHDCPELLIFTDAIRILETMESAGRADYEDIRAMTRAYRDYRRVAHAAALQRQRAMIDRDSRREAERQAVAELWDRWIDEPASRAGGGPADGHSNDDSK
ncbi:bifunctional [glutamate--ammonia ligase]-adenylyl-L-tyrosine phosphorylase/[glutamate--ammonia-ligase] adenylyltransferase [Salinisphaera sp.]|uniref:bifunctional [glutamate--ammonia ligase]-adenylyl-L-tyrosine phosphorylase/[glutamate--ammonia-ligase] adenylyltransferase n=1 Tax=Salinisphaera sp. TaxID=1914330 RepID=UPI002D77FFAB|nr:bifunctional [glutamate--ammonia ligase]-adenylyl-L-tyrosine phosphorylase/[glutamate--ammonia-ligase] adenylyltransferase [Salinisphaera sp.]HET7313110.1 bifunctional [glutamate--ammonia ligase]-adenylyl-L-tyrosine phosphorylase/[glutamate--ammonia-ligase] adenylyltransferase [Salinisphaera sp.]